MQTTEGWIVNVSPASTLCKSWIHGGQKYHVAKRTMKFPDFTTPYRRCTPRLCNHYASASVIYQLQSFHYPKSSSHYTPLFSHTEAQSTKGPKHFEHLAQKQLRFQTPNNITSPSMCASLPQTPVNMTASLPPAPVDASTCRLCGRNYSGSASTCGCYQN